MSTLFSQEKSEDKKPKSCLHFNKLEGSQFVQEAFAPFMDSFFDKLATKTLPISSVLRTFLIFLLRLLFPCTQKKKKLSY